MLAPSIIACARVRRQGRAGHSRYQSELLPPRPSSTWSNELPSLSSVYARASWPQADAATAICSCRPAVTWLSDWPGSRPTVVPSGLRPRAQTAGSVPLTDQPTRALLWSSMATDGVLAPAAVDTGTSACRPVSFTVISYAFVAVPVNPAAFTVAAAVPWMSSHTTVKATAVVLPGAPSGSTDTLGDSCWPAVLALA